MSLTSLPYGLTDATTTMNRVGIGMRSRRAERCVVVRLFVMAYI